MTSLQIKEILCLIYSAVLFFSGAVLIGFAIVLTYKVLFYHFTFIPNNTIAPFIVIFALGILHLLITWIGVKGPSKQHDFFIVLFGVTTIVLLIVEFSIGMWSLVLRSQVEDRSLVLMKKSHAKYVQEYTLGKEKSEWIRLQSMFECCGINGTADYVRLPPSCFKCQLTDVINKTRTCTETYQIGCKDRLVPYVRKLLLEVSLIAILSALLQVVGTYVFVDFYRSLRADRAQRAVSRASRLRRSQGHRDSRLEGGSNAENNETLTRPNLPRSPSAPS